MSAAAKLSPQEYAEVLQERANAHRASHPHRLGAPPMLEWFIREEDTDLVDMDAIETANASEDQDRAPARRPRNFRPAREIRADLERVEARLSALVGSGDRHPTTDVAAYAGIGIRQSPRQRARHGARIDATAAEVTRLTQRRKELSARLARAQAREARASRID